MACQILRWSFTWARAGAEVQTAGDDAARAAREVETDAEATEVEASHEASRAASPLVTAL